MSDLMVLVGTRKGAFVLGSDGSRKRWSVSGPHFSGGDVFHLAHDPRDGGVLWAASNNPVWGPEIQRSHDLGTTTGQVFYSRDGGDNWELLIDHLPPINSVECAEVA